MVIRRKHAALDPGFATALNLQCSSEEFWLPSLKVFEISVCAKFAPKKVTWEKQAYCQVSVEKRGSETPMTKKVMVECSVTLHKIIHCQLPPSL